MLDGFYLPPSCPSCHAFRPKDDWYCRNCGALLPVIKKESGFAILLGLVGVVSALGGVLAVYWASFPDPSAHGSILQGIVLLGLALFSFWGCIQFRKKTTERNIEKRDQAMKAFMSATRPPAPEHPCPSCGVRVGEDDKFCYRCAATLSPIVVPRPGVISRLVPYVIVVILILPSVIIYDYPMLALALFLTIVLTLLVVKSFNRRSQKEEQTNSSSGTG